MVETTILQFVNTVLGIQIVNIASEFSNGSKNNFV